MKKTVVIVSFERIDTTGFREVPGWLFDLVSKLLPFLKIVIEIREHGNG